MDRINNFYITNLNFNYIQYFILLENNTNNSEFFFKVKKQKNLFFFKFLNLKKINLNKKCMNIIYF